MALFMPQAIGFVRSPYTDSKAIPKGLGVKHDAEGVLEILPEFEPGLADVEGFSHLFVIWTFDRSEGFELVGRTPIDELPHGVFATRSPRRPNPIALTVVELLSREGRQLKCAGWICSMALQSSISSLTYRAFRRRSFVAAGSQKPRNAFSIDPSFDVQFGRQTSCSEYRVSSKSS